MTLAFPKGQKPDVDLMQAIANQIPIVSKQRDITLTDIQDIEGE